MRPQFPVEHNDFRFSPVTASFEGISGSDQFGNTFDDWGNRFICDESHPLSQPVLPRAALARNPMLLLSSVVQDIAGGSVPIFRISPVERWRQIRSSRRIAHGTRSAESAGASHHVVDAGAGVTIYRGSAYPAEFYGNVFIGDAQNNLVHRRILVPDGPTFKAIRGPREQATEFIRSSDNWFRPVNFVNAPDGTLYVLDMSREVIEAIHIPLDVVKHLNLKRGREQGRIYRIAPPSFRYAPPPRLSQAPMAELIAALSRPDAWYRDTAHRLIFERQDPAAIEPLRKMLGPRGAPGSQSQVSTPRSPQRPMRLRSAIFSERTSMILPLACVRRLFSLRPGGLVPRREVVARSRAGDFAEQADAGQKALRGLLAIGEIDDPRGRAPALLVDGAPIRRQSVDSCCRALLGFSSCRADAGRRTAMTKSRSSRTPPVRVACG